MAESTATDSTEHNGQRGPLDHKRRQQILQAASEHFGHYGYRKTALSDIAKAINLSTAYLYKFFDSKQAIGEAICSQTLATILGEVTESVDAADSSPEKMRRIFLGLESHAWVLLNEERKMFDLVSASYEERWSSLKRFRDALIQLVKTVVVHGRESGEFERKTPLDETCRAIAKTTELFFTPTLLEHAGKSQAEDALAVAGIVIRSLTA